MTNQTSPGGRVQTPSIGRVVHFVNGDQHVPALITHPNFNEQGECALTVFPVNEPPFTTVAAFDPNAVPGTWHWPEYVP